MTANTPIYDTIGQSYAVTRRADSRIEKQVHGALGDAKTVLNVGAGTGNYEPDGLRVIALEPSLAMISQRPVEAAPVVCGVGESLPFADGSFDAVMAILTLHHWTDQVAGLKEMQRVARRRVVIFTFDASMSDSFWLVRDYLRGNIAVDRQNFFDIDELSSFLNRPAIHPVPIPEDCQVGFLCAFWKRPAAYLSADVQAGISSFSALSPPEVERGLAVLRDDLKTGRWLNKNRDIEGLKEKDLGYRLIVAEAS